jgi:hypothetical protein
MNNRGKVFYVLNKLQTNYKGPTSDYISFATSNLRASSELECKKVLRKIQKSFIENANENANENAEVNATDLLEGNSNEDFEIDSN